MTRLYARRYTNSSSILTEIGASAVGVMTALGPIELSSWYHDGNFASLRSPEGNVLMLIPEAANAMRVRPEQGFPRFPELSPAHPADSSIEKIVRALDDLRVRSALIRRSDQTRTIDQRAKHARNIEFLCDKIQEALVECVTE